MVGVLGLVAVLSAQSPPPQPTFRASTTLAQIEVAVVDATGQPVHGLTKGDFTIVEGVTDRPVVAFDEFSRDDDFSLPTFPPSFKLDVADNAVARMDRLVVLVLDDLHAFRERDETVKRLARAVVNNLGPRASLAFTTTSGNQKTGFTTDRSKVLALIDAFEGGKKQRRPGPVEMARLTDFGAAVGADRVPTGDKERAVESGAARVASVPTGPNDLATLFGDITTFDALADAARRLAGEQGRRKAFIFVSEGSAVGGSRVSDARSAMMVALRRSGVAVYTIDPRGHVPHGSSLMFVECSGDSSCMRESWQRTWVEDAQVDLQGLAQVTGGLAIVNTDEVFQGVSRVLDDLENYYVLGFNPLGVEGNAPSPITIQTIRSGLTLRYRRRFEPAPAAPAPTARPLVDLAAGLLPKSELPLQAYAVALPAAGKAARVAFWLEVRGDALAMTDADGALRDTLQYLVMPVDNTHGKTLSGISKVGHVVLRPKSTSTAGRRQRVVYTVDAVLDVKPGAYQFRLSATSLRLQKSGSVFLTMDVPDFSRARLALSGLMLGYDGPPRAPVSGSAAANAKLPFPVTLDRLFRQDDRVRIVCEVARASPAAGAIATVDVVNEAGITVQSLHPILSNRPLDRIDVVLPLIGLVPASYRLRVRVSDGVASTAQEIAFRVAGL
jgi:VWFA-related protein